jgi:hypothetical protein
MTDQPKLPNNMSIVYGRENKLTSNGDVLELLSVPDRKFIDGAIVNFTLAKYGGAVTIQIKIISANFMRPEYWKNLLRFY